MKNKKGIQRISTILAALFALAIFQIIGSGCGGITQHASDRDSNSVTGGGQIISFVEKHLNGTFGNNSVVIPYRVFSEYTGSVSVQEITAVWTVSTNFQRQSSPFTATLVVPGRDREHRDVRTIPAGTGRTNGPTVTLSLSNTNGVNLASWPSNTFTVSTSTHSGNQGRSLRNQASLRIAGNATTFRADVTVRNGF